MHFSVSAVLALSRVFFIWIAVKNAEPRQKGSTLSDSSLTKQKNSVSTS